MPNGRESSHKNSSISKWARENPPLFHGVVLVLLSGIFTGVIVILHDDIKSDIAIEKAERKEQVNKLQKSLALRTSAIREDMAKEIGKLQKSYEMHRIDMRDMSEQLTKMQTVTNLYVIPTLNEIKSEVKRLRADKLGQLENGRNDHGDG